MKKSLLSVALMAMLGSSSLMADIDDYVANDNNESVVNFALKMIEMAEKGNMDIIDFYSNQVLPSEAGLPLTQEDLKERIVAKSDNYVIVRGNEVEKISLVPQASKINDGAIELNIGCFIYNSNNEIDFLVIDSNKPLVVSIENGKYRIKSMPAQTQEGCHRLDY